MAQQSRDDRALPRRRGRGVTPLVICALTAVAAPACTARQPVARASHVPTGGGPADIASLVGAWVDDGGRATRLEAYRGEPVILTMFYRSCQTRCPITLARLQRVAAMLERRAVTASFLLVTLDPRNDSPAHLAAFKREHHLAPSWHLLRGDERDTRALARQLGLRVAYDDMHMDHDVRVLGYDSRGRLELVFDDWHFDESSVDALVTRRP